MKTVSTMAITALLSIGLAGNALAAGGHKAPTQGKGANKVTVVKQAPKKQVKKTYKVRKGDTLYRIAAKNKTSVTKLMRLNNLTPKKAKHLKVGMVLRVA